MGKVIYIRTGDGVLLRFEDPKRVRAWLSNGRLTPDDVYLGPDQAWHPLADLEDLAGALVQAPVPGPAASGAPSAPQAPVVQAPVAPPPPVVVAPPARPAAGDGPTERETRRLPVVEEAPAAAPVAPPVAAPVAPPVAAPEPLATTPFVAIREAPVEVEVEVEAAAAPQSVAMPVPEPQAPAPEPEAAAPQAAVPAPAEPVRPAEPLYRARDRSVPVAPAAPADEPMGFPSETDPFGRAGDGELWASDPVGAAARRKAVIRRAVPFALLVALALGSVIALVIQANDSALPDLRAPEAPTAAVPAAPQAPAVEPAAASVPVPPPAAAVPAAAPVTVPEPAPVPVPEPAPVAAPVPVPVSAPVVVPVPVPVPDPAPVAAPAPAPAPPPKAVVDSPARFPVPASAERTAPAPRAAAVEPPARATAPAVRALPVPREPPAPARTAARSAAAGGEVASSEEPGTYDAHMAAGNRELNKNPAVALDEFRLAAQARPSRVEPVARMGECAVRMGDLENAERQFRAALKLGASYAPALVGMARVQKARGNVSDARYYYTRYLEVNPKGSQAEEAQSYLERNP
jgi:hypothetical protein